MFAEPGVGVHLLRALERAGFAPAAVVTRVPGDGLVPSLRRSGYDSSAARAALPALAAPLVRRMPRSWAAAVPAPNTWRFSASRGWPVIPWRQDDPRGVGEAVTRHGASIGLVFGFPLLSDEVRRAPRDGCIGFHPSLLPRHRGASPTFWSVAAAEAEVGVSLFRLDDGIDTGEVLLQLPVPVSPLEDEPALLERLALLGARLFAAWLVAREQGIEPDFAAARPSRQGDTRRPRQIVPLGLSPERRPSLPDRTLSPQLDAGAMIARVHASMGRGCAMAPVGRSLVPIFDAFVTTGDRTEHGGDAFRCNGAGDVIAQAACGRVVYLIADRTAATA